MAAAAASNPSPDPIAAARSRLGVASRLRGTDSPEALDARRELEAAKLERHIREVVDGAPPLTDAQLDELASILRQARRGHAPVGGAR